MINIAGATADNTNNNFVSEKSQHKTDELFSDNTLETIQGKDLDDFNNLREEIKASAVSDHFIGCAVDFLPDIEIDPLTHEVVGTPIADASGRTFVRFGRTVKSKSVAIHFTDKDDETWQLKVSYPGKDNGDRGGEYWAPKDIGDKPYLAKTPREFEIQIAEKHNLLPCVPGQFWEWFNDNKQIPLVLTEGGKKSLAAMSAGDTAIALYGCTCGITKDKEIKPGLLPYVEGRTVIIALDEDFKRDAKKAVRLAQSKLSKAIAKAGGTALIASWEGRLGKGLDDLLASHPETYSQIMLVS